MAIVGTYTDKQNPEYTIDDFCFWIPKMAKFMKTEEGEPCHCSLCDTYRKANE